MRETLQRRFDRCVRTTPDALALVCGETRVSYAELDDASTRLAHRLQALGAAPETVVAADLDHAPSALVALVAIVKTGAAFAAIPPADPPARVREILADCGARLLVTNRQRTEALPLDGLSIQSIALADTAPAREERPARATRDDDLPDRLFQVVYTSGSTGRPKAVLVPEAAVLHRIDGMAARYPFLPQDVALLHRPFSIIGASWDVFAPLLAGIPTLIVPRFDPAAPHIWRQLAAWRVSHAAAAPVLWQLVIEQAERTPGIWTSLRLAITGGQPIDGAFVRRWRATFPETRLLNVYAATECVSPVAHEVAAADAALPRVPAGTPFAGVRVEVVDAAGHAVPDGEPGEICIGGDCLARGYLHAPALTAERFVPDAAGARAGARLFRTGDLGIRTADGRLQIHGRRDRQIKLRGFRIDPGEIEAALAHCPGVEAAAVVARPEAHGDGELVAYIVTADRQPLSLAALRAWLGARLPSYMIPASVVTLAELPRTHSGKIDLPRLPAAAPPPAPAKPSPSSSPSRSEGMSPLLWQITQIWRDVLAVDDVSQDADFFALGGDSLAAMRIAARLRETLRIDLPVSRVLDGATVASLARELSAHALAQEDRHAPLPTD